MEFKCSLCDYKSSRKSHIVQHINRKIKCGDGIPDILVISVDISCEYCKKSYSLKKNLILHQKTCKTKKLNQDEEIRILKEKLAISEALNKKPSTVNNTQININLSPWNDPKLPKNIDEYYQSAIKKIFLAVPTLIKFIHFNTDHPENHNISIQNARTKTAKVFNGKEWETIDEDLLIQSLIYDYEHTLEDYAEENHPTYLKKIKEIKDRDSEEKVYDDLHNEVKRVIYDRNYMVKTK